MSNNNYGRPTQEESEQLHRDAMDHSFGRAESLEDKQFKQENRDYEANATRGSIQTSYATALICKQLTKPEHIAQATEVFFIDLKHVTKEGALDQGALLLELCYPDTQEVIEIWMPKKLCSNLDMDTMSVYVWTTFLKDKYPLLIE